MITRGDMAGGMLTGIINMTGTINNDDNLKILDKAFPKHGRALSFSGWVSQIMDICKS